MTTTGRPAKADKLIARTVRNRPDVDAVLVRMAARWGMPMADLTRHACEALAGREDELVDLAGPLEVAMDVQLPTVQVVPVYGEDGTCRLVPVQEWAKREGEG